MFSFNRNQSISLLGENDLMQLITKKALLNVEDMEYNTTSANSDPYQYNLS